MRLLNLLGSGFVLMGLTGLAQGAGSQDPSNTRSNTGTSSTQPRSDTTGPSTLTEDSGSTSGSTNRGSSTRPPVNQGVYSSDNTDLNGNTNDQQRTRRMREGSQSSGTGKSYRPGTGRGRSGSGGATGGTTDGTGGSSGTTGGGSTGGDGGTTGGGGSGGTTGGSGGTTGGSGGTTGGGGGSTGGTGGTTASLNASRLELAMNQKGFLVADNSQKSADVKNNTDSDTELTRKIREEIVKSDLSTRADNVTIATTQGKVLISGTVASQEERKRVLDIARKIAGQNKVESNLTVKN